MRRWRLPALLAVLVGLMAWAWSADRSGPAHPHGQFVALVATALLLVGLTASVAATRGARPEP